ncbi:MAG: excinuclease ABC subunit UvrC [Candidatus Caenarcaniphilales bacterium]|nr:excinuclease ABC subunit UvrC [Candidatus Caenarcaniphilales bacterium]
MLNLADLPQRPGVYIFRDDQDQIIYIGKALNLRSRVRSYWSKNAHFDRPKLIFLVPKIAHVETIITLNEKEALILEASLIYKHQPRYNVLLKDDKSFPWIAITYGEPFPRLIPVRDLKWVKRKYPKSKLFGPYTDTGAMYRTLQTARELFPLRKRAKPLFRDRPCLNYHLGQCLGPCQSLVTEDEYNQLLRQIELFLNGKHEDLLKDLALKMEAAAERQDFERAAKYRDRIKVVRKESENQRIVTDDPYCNRDLIGFASNGEDLAIQIFKMRNGKLIGREGYLVECNELQTPLEMIQSSLEQAYILRQAEDIPAEIFIQSEIKGFLSDLMKAELEGISFLSWFEGLLDTLTERVVKVQSPRRGEKKEQVELAAYNAHQQLDSKARHKAKTLIALDVLREILGLEVSPHKIDCFDISHLQGTQVVASCIRFLDAEPDKSYYRRFKLKIDQNDDFYSMKEVVKRRYQSLEKNGDLPDLILIDGGKGQLSAAREAISELGLEDRANLISLAKKEEEIYCLSGEKKILPRNSPALQVLQRARDEAHRFALSYNRKRRQASAKESFLDGIPYIGARTKERLMKNFTLKELMAASPQAINQKLKIGSKRADRLWQALHKAKAESKVN